jgi:hypothetical protein
MYRVRTAESAYYLARNGWRSESGSRYGMSLAQRSPATVAQTEECGRLTHLTHLTRKSLLLLLYRLCLCAHAALYSPAHSCD